MLCEFACKIDPIRQLSKITESVVRMLWGGVASCSERRDSHPVGYAAPVLHYMMALSGNPWTILRLIAFFNEPFAKLSARFGVAQSIDAVITF